MQRRAGLIAATAAIALALLRAALVEVRGRSMEPTLRPGERLLTLPARRPWLRAGQVVVLEDPEWAGHLVIKRIARIAGDRVDVRGDNPDASTDGRRWGLVPAARVRRIAVARWPHVGDRLGRR